ncbi:hypothetical protein B0T21DRAFT_381900 [Apiosordaria backusii]|uniref:Uncharacterized protein n=1 Tax=Apiosordaria backusii TaxID=314023 RepID=A0AA40EMU0_9PEZI|nr:hypothetical protein B0T21DRAFT_381900 [Apiosordaria backusii]
MCQTHQSQSGCHQPTHPLLSLSVPILIPCPQNCGYPTIPGFLETIRCDILSRECPYCIEEPGPNGALPADSAPHFVNNDPDDVEDLRQEAIDFIQEAEYVNNTEGIEPTELSLEFEEMDLTCAVPVVEEVEEEEEEEEEVLTPTGIVLPEAKRFVIVEGEGEPEDMALTPTDTIVFRF